MSTPRLLKGGLVVVDSLFGSVGRVVPFQYNPDTVTRTLQPQMAGGEEGGRSESPRFRAAPTETFRVEVELDATDDLEKKDPQASALGVHARLAALESLVYPSSTMVLVNDILARVGTLEVLPMRAPLLVFVWSKERVLPVRLTEMTVTEEAYDAALNPIRVKVSLSLRALGVDDLGLGSRGGALALAHHMRKEALAARHAGALGALGLGGLP